MPKIKILPPKQLPEYTLSQQDFEDWQNELEIYLGGDEDMARFMTGGRYHTWESQERYPDRIHNLDARDPDRPQQDAANREDKLTDLLARRRCELQTFLGQDAKSASKNMYAMIVKHATSLEWIYTHIRERTMTYNRKEFTS